MDENISTGALELTVGAGVIRTERPAFVMGILNVTPDSFWEKSRAGADAALRMADEGADMIDIGGESTRPGFVPVDADEEIRRIVPVIREIRRHSRIPVSVDTRKAVVMRAAADEGADMLNDVSALEDDPEIADVAAEAGLSVVLMHRFTGDEDTRTGSPDILGEVGAYLDRRAEFAVSRGILPERIIVDPGIGFGKTFAENTALIGNSAALCGGKYPVMMALSRKRCIGTMTGRPVEDRLAGTLAADMISVLGGARIVRVHDVRETVDTLNVIRYII